MTQTLDVDVAIIGAGTAGMAAYEQVAKQTHRVVAIAPAQRPRPFR